MSIYDKIKVITYATHSEGTFNEMMNNNFNMKIDVLGYGDEWKGFMNKIKTIYEYLQNISDDVIVVIIDGFDTEINGYIETVYKKFLDMNTRILLSTCISNVLSKRVYGTCIGNITANGGLYMGYVKDIKELYKLMIENAEGNDDQFELNKNCKFLKDRIKIDAEGVIFKNIRVESRVLSGIIGETYTNAVFIGNPGQISFSRLKRVPDEFFHLFKNELMVFLLFICVFLIYKIKNS